MDTASIRAHAAIPSTCDRPCDPSACAVARKNGAFAVLDYFETVRTYPTFKRFKVGDSLFAQYTCPVREPSIGIWTHTDHLVHVISGQKTWKTTAGTWTAEAGETLFFKKGAYVLNQSFLEDFCVLVFFIPDPFVRDIVNELAGELPAMTEPVDLGEMAIRVKSGAALSAFLQSMGAYFADDDVPPDALLRLKLRELITALLLGRHTRTLSDYFRANARNDLPSVPAIMEANFCHNLPIEAFAKLCHRSLSSFKRKFMECYGVAPGRWLLERRLERAGRLLQTTDMNVTEVVFECGFESPAHFSRAFRHKFRRSPSEHRAMRDSAGTAHVA